MVVTTNIGWHPETGRNNMGAGMALQAALRFPGLRVREFPGIEPARDSDVPPLELEQQPLDTWYGSMCEQLGEETPVLAYPYERRIILFPVKPLKDRANPERSWDAVADLGLIYRGLMQLRGFQGRIALSHPGAGNGKLDPEIVARLVENVLGQDPDPSRFTLVTFKSSVSELPLLGQRQR